MEQYITIKWRAPWWRFWNRKPDVETYRGGGTVWHHYPSGKRCATYLESSIGDEVVRREMVSDRTKTEQIGG